jgi:N-acetyl-anhydromuramyl-L-alanine amidase AmpD
MKKQKIKDIYRIVIHCSATREDVDYTYEHLLRDHKARGFDTCGYHYFIRKSGIIYKGRSNDVVGAHAPPNTNTIGICYEGGLDKKSTIKKTIAKDTRTEAQKEQILNCIFDVLKQVRVAGGKVSKIEIVGHRDLSPDLDGDGIVEPQEWIKQCPCFDAKEEYKDITKLF